MRAARADPGPNPMHDTDTSAWPPFEWELGTYEWTWPQIVRRALAEIGGKASLSALYKAIEGSKMSGRGAARKGGRSRSGRTDEAEEVNAMVSHGRTENAVRPGSSSFTIESSPLCPARIV